MKRGKNQKQATKRTQNRQTSKEIENLWWPLYHECRAPFPCLCRSSQKLPNCPPGGGRLSRPTYGHRLCCGCGQLQAFGPVPRPDHFSGFRRRGCAVIHPAPGSLWPVPTFPVSCWANCRTVSLQGLLWPLSPHTPVPGGSLVLPCSDLYTSLTAEPCFPSWRTWHSASFAHPEWWAAGQGSSCCRSL